MEESDLPRITSWKQFQELLAAGHTFDERVNAEFMLKVECAVCGLLWGSDGLVFMETGEPVPYPDSDSGIARVGTVYIPDGEHILLVDDAKKLLQEHIDTVHVGWRFVIDGSHRMLRARRCGRRRR